MANEHIRQEAAGAPVHASYDPIYFAPLYAAEDRHFWFRTRNRVIATLVEQVTAHLEPGYRVLEVGCGTGNVLRELHKVCVGGVVIGMDLFAEGLQYARLRTDGGLIRGDMHKAPFHTQFDLIGLFDVLEHLPDDVQVLRDLHAMLNPGGALLLTVPAHPTLWSYFDVASHHCRRYELAEMQNKLVDAGYRIEYLTQYMSGIFPLVWAGRRLAALFDRRQRNDITRSHDLASSELRVIPVVNDLLSWLLSQEAGLIARRRPILIGTSLIAIARKGE